MSRLDACFSGTAHVLVLACSNSAFLSVSKSKTDMKMDRARDWENEEGKKRGKKKELHLQCACIKKFSSRQQEGGGVNALFNSPPPTLSLYYLLYSAKIKGIKRLAFLYYANTVNRPVNSCKIFTSFSCQKVYFSVFPNITCLYNLLI